MEGVGSSRKEFNDFISLRIFVDTSKNICLKRGVERDTGTGKSIEELTEMWNKWFEVEEAYMDNDNPKAKADIMIDGTRPFDEQFSV